MIILIEPLNFFFGRGRKVLENRNLTDLERIVQLEKELETIILLGEDSDRKYEEVQHINIFVFLNKSLIIISNV